MSLLAQFLGPVPVAETQALLNGRRWGHFPCGGGERLTGLVTWDDAIELFNMADVTAPTGLSLCKEGRPVPNHWLTRLSGQKAPQGDSFAALARQGFTFFLHRQDQKSPRLARLRREAEQVFPGPLQVGLVGSFGPGRGLHPHADRTDVVVVQVAGIKEWELLGETQDLDSRETHPGPSDSIVTGRFTLHPGDVAVIPYGQGHHCRTEGHSLHLGLALCGTTPQDYLAWLERQAQGLPPFRRPVPYGADAAALADYDAQLRRLILDLMDRHSPSAWLDSLSRQRGRDIGADDVPPDPFASQTIRR